MSLPPSNDPAVRYLAQQIAQIKRDVRSQARGSQAAFRGVELSDGTTEYYDEDGNVVGEVGEDGPVVIVSDLPPEPTEVTLSLAPGAIVVSYDGTFVDDNWSSLISHVELHALDDPAQVMDDGTQISTFTSSNGGSFTHTVDDPAKTWWYRLVAVSVAGVEGPGSVAVFGSSDYLVSLQDLVDLQTDLDANQAELDNLNGAVLPDLRADLSLAQTQIVSIYEFDLPYLNTALSSAQGEINVLNNNTIPALATDLATAQGDLSYVKDVAFPELRSDLDDAIGGINYLDTVTLPALNSDLAAAQQDIATLQESSGGESILPITETEIADGAITTPKMTANTIDGDRITANTLSAGKIIAGSITTDRMTANSINADRLAVNTLSADRIVANSITTGQITAAGVNGDRITANTLNADRIVAGSITTDRMTANSINGDRVTANTLNAAKIVAGSITTDLMTANTINGDRVTANTLAAAKIIAGSITTDRMTANSINADRLAVNTLNADRIIVNTLNGDRIIANTLQGDRIVANTLNGDRIIAGTINADRIIANTLQSAIVSAGAVNGITITGTTFQTASSGNRLVARADASGGIIEGFSGSSAETGPAKINFARYTPNSGASDQLGLDLVSPSTSGGGAKISIRSAYRPDPVNTPAVVVLPQVIITADTAVTGILEVKGTGSALNMNGLNINSVNAVNNSTGSVGFNVLNGRGKVSGGANIGVRFGQDPSTAGSGSAVTMTTSWVAATTDSMNAATPQSGNTRPFYANLVYGFGAYQNASDEREKQNITLVDPAFATDIIERLNIKSFTMPNVEPDREQYGIIAQEAEPIIPSAITKIGNRLAASYQDLFALNIAAVQDLLRRVAAIEQAMASNPDGV